MSTDIYVARQPIFDRHRRVVAYELLFRSGTTNSFGNHDPSIASVQMLDTTVLGFGLDSLLGKHLGFYNASRRMLMEQHWSILPPATTVIELLETVDPDEDVVAACRGIKQAGYQLALDDFVFRPEFEALIPIADYIKVDFLATPPDERKRLAKRYGTRGIRMLAEKVETYADFDQGLQDGYELFQGYFFCKPEVVTGKAVAPLKTTMARLIAEVNRPELDFDSLENLIKQEVALSIKLLRYLRSAGFGWRHDVQSISQALRILGEKAARKWASLVALTMIGDDKPQELITASLIRAQFCEEVGVRRLGEQYRSEAFLVGLLSTLDALLDRPMGDLLEQMAVSPDVVQALLGGASPLADVLRVVIAYDQGEWDRVDTLAAQAETEPTDLSGFYYQSLKWVDNLMAEAA